MEYRRVREKSEASVRTKAAQFTYLGSLVAPANQPPP